jgi:DNA-binding response OmpR family regulator
LNDHFNAETPIDLLFSDWNMPILSGIDLLIAVRQSENFKDLPFIMVTAEGQRDQVMLAIKVGVSNYIVKPFPPVQLELKIQAVWDKLTARKKNQINKPSEESIASDQSQASVEANASDQSQGSDQNTST